MDTLFTKALKIATAAVTLSATSGFVHAACVVDGTLKNNILAAWAANPAPSDTVANPNNITASKLEEVFNPTYYLQVNTDVAAAVGNSDDAALNHWLNDGICEARASSPTFSMNAYKKYSDLSTAFGNNNWAYLAHYFNYGAAEGRCAVEGNEVPTQVIFSNTNTIASYPSRGTVYTNNSTGGLVIKNSGGDGNSQFTACTGRMPNFVNVNNSVQTISFQFAASNFFIQSGMGNHIGVLGTAKAHLARNPNQGLSGYNAAGIIFWGNNGWSGAETEVFSSRRVNQNNTFGPQLLERSSTGGDSTAPIYDTFDPITGTGQYYQALVKVKNNVVKYTIQRPDGSTLVQDRTFTFPAGLTTPFGDGLGLFAICKHETGAACSGNYNVVFRNISVSWGQDSSF